MKNKHRETQEEKAAAWIYPIIRRSEYSFLLLVRLMKFLLWGTVAIVSQSWRQSALGLLVIRMPHDDKCLAGHRKTGIMSTDSRRTDTHTTEESHYIPATCCETE